MYLSLIAREGGSAGNYILQFTIFHRATLLKNLFICTKTGTLSTNGNSFEQAEDWYAQRISVNNFTEIIDLDKRELFRTGCRFTRLLINVRRVHSPAMVDLRAENRSDIFFARSWLSAWISAWLSPWLSPWPSPSLSAWLGLARRLFYKKIPFTPNYRAAGDFFFHSFFSFQKQKKKF